MNLSASPAEGYAFVGWSGWGPGSYNGTNRTATIDPTGRLSEEARFVVGDQVVLWESGLPGGTPWSVTVRGFTTNSSTNLLTVYEPLGTFGYTVNPVPGYRSLPENGGFSVTGPYQLVKVQFVLLTPPPPAFAVAFQVSGLPGSTPVTITVRDVLETAGVVLPEFQLLNGSYAYHVGYVPGYHPEVAEKTFVVHGGPLTVDVPFVPTVYDATWEANGTRPGMNWSVQLNGVTIPATSAWVSSSLPNGTYSYAIVVPANFSASPRTGILSLHGFSATLPLVFSLVEFPTRFEASGPGSSTTWAIRLGSVTQPGVSEGVDVPRAERDVHVRRPSPGRRVRRPLAREPDGGGTHPADCDPVPPGLRPAVGGARRRAELGGVDDLAVDRRVDRGGIRGPPRAATPGWLNPLTAGSRRADRAPRPGEAGPP